MAFRILWKETNIMFEEEEEEENNDDYDEE